MPWHVDRTDACPASKPYGVIKDADGSVDGRCHPTREQANKQMAALYAAEPQASRRAPVAESHQLAGGLQLFVRSFPLEDIRIRSGGDGRTVEAYAAVFDTPAEIRDQDGHYNEVNDRVMFNRAISDAAPAGGRTSWRVGVFYNHARDIYGGPSDRGSMPIGTPLEIKADSRGLLTVTRYSRTALADEVLESIREGAISGYSFQGMFMRSQATDHAGRPITRVPRGGFRPTADGQLVTVRRLESSLREYGPTPFPAYAEAAVLGMRAAQLLNYLPAGERAQLADLLRDDAHPDAPDDPDSSDDQSSPDAPDADAAEATPEEGLVADDPPTPEGEHSSRHALLQRIAVAKTTRPGLARDPRADAVRARVEAIARPERTGS